MPGDANTRFCRVEGGDARRALPGAASHRPGLRHGAPRSPRHHAQRSQVSRPLDPSRSSALLAHLIGGSSSARSPRRAATRGPGPPPPITPGGTARRPVEIPYLPACGVAAGLAWGRMTRRTFDTAYTDHEVRALTRTPKRCRQCGRMTALLTFTTYEFESRRLSIRNPDGCRNADCPTNQAAAESNASAPPSPRRGRRHHPHDTRPIAVAGSLSGRLLALLRRYRGRSPGP